MNRQDYFRMMRHSQLTKQAMVKNASLQKFAAEESWGTKTGNWLQQRWSALIKFFKDLFAAWKGKKQPVTPSTTTNSSGTTPSTPGAGTNSSGTGEKGKVDVQTVNKVKKGDSSSVNLIPPTSKKPDPGDLDIFGRPLSKIHQSEVEKKLQAQKDQQEDKDTYNSQQQHIQNAANDAQIAAEKELQQQKVQKAKKYTDSLTEGLKNKLGASPIGSLFFNKPPTPKEAVNIAVKDLKNTANAGVNAARYVGNGLTGVGRTGMNLITGAGVDAAKYVGNGLTGVGRTGMNLITGAGKQIASTLSNASNDIKRAPQLFQQAADKLKDLQKKTGKPFWPTGKTVGHNVQTIRNFLKRFF